MSNSLLGLLRRNGQRRSKRTAPALHLLVSAILLWGCSSGQQPPPETSNQALSASASSAPPLSAIDEYATLPPEQRERPPESGPSPDWSFPPIQDAVLENGLKLKTLTRQGLPLVEIKLVFLSGQATDGNRPGLALLGGELLKVGGSGPYTSRQLLNKVESLGSSLSVITSGDATSITLSVTKDHVDEAMDLLGLVVQKPQFSASEFKKLKQRETDRVTSLARSSASWVSSMVMYRELYHTEGGNHPYAHYDVTAAELQKVALWEVTQWARTHLVPTNAFLVFAGDITTDQAASVAKKALGAWRGKAPPSISFPSVSAPSALELLLIDRPGSPQAEVQLAMLGPERKAQHWAELKVANQVLGGGVSGRLFGDIREKQSLAYSTYSYVGEVAHGPGPLVLKAGTQTAKAGLTLRALLEHARQIAEQPATEAETEIARRYLSDVFLLRMETVGDMASMAANLGIFDLPNNYYDDYRKALGETTAITAQAAARAFFRPQHALVIVAGDAERLSLPLSHFGEVQILDADKDFALRTKVPHNPDAKIELERIDGT